jgi:hypothetical protein
MTQGLSEVYSADLRVEGFHIRTQGLVKLELSTWIVKEVICDGIDNFIMS